MLHQKKIQENPSIILIIIRLNLEPYLSISFPICGSKNAAIKVANPYADAIEVVDIAKSLLMGPTKTLKVCDWPGPLEKIPRFATPTIIQP